MIWIILGAAIVAILFAGAMSAALAESMDEAVGLFWGFLLLIAVLAAVAGLLIGAFEMIDYGLGQVVYGNP